MLSPVFMHRVQQWAAALELTCRVHSGAVRDDKSTPYAIHPIRVAELLRHIGGESNTEILIAALLHDSIEKTFLTFEELNENFGVTVAGIVKELTITDTLPAEVRFSEALKHTAKLSEAAKKIKLADRLDNMLDLLRGCGTREKRDRYLLETDTVLRDCQGSCPFVEIELSNALKRLQTMSWPDNP